MKEFIVDGNVGGYYDDNGRFIVCEECGTDEDFDTHAVEVMNGDGYYDSNGRFVRFTDGD